MEKYPEKSTQDDDAIIMQSVTRGSYEVHLKLMINYKK